MDHRSRGGTQRLSGLAVTTQATQAGAQRMGGAGIPGRHRAGDMGTHVAVSERERFCHNAAPVRFLETTVVADVHTRLAGGAFCSCSLEDSHDDSIAG